ncbi:MAG: ATP-binding protein [Burkholderiales bacterium]|jgi:signal transduction histidine kinase|nr:ATP-binding protein [Burkholderiales bacterium]MDP4909116.1 ATP-binding protein [Burkholderiaceae bacterium]
MSFLPRSLFSRLVIVFLIGLIVAQAISLTIVLQDRGEFLSRTSGVQSVRRIADTVILFDTVNTVERVRLVKLLNSPSMRITITPTPPLLPSVPTPESVNSAQSMFFTSLLQRMLGREREMRLVLLEPTDKSSLPRAEHSGGMPHHRSQASGMVPQPGLAAGRYRMRQTASVVVQIRLDDSNWATFDSQLQPETWTWPLRALLSALVLLSCVVLLAIVGVRWVTRPLNDFSLAATELGKNIDRPPLPETGPIEVVQAARALNGMQARLSRYLQDRTRILAAMSHDLKTPITRMRLRAELLDDKPVREKFIRDLSELEGMVSGTLSFMRGLEATEAAVPLDMNALLESLQADFQEAGEHVEILGRTTVPYLCRPQSMKRCLSNLIENAIKYGHLARVSLIQLPSSIHIVVSDEGPGVPVEELERLFDPFYRLDASRNREHGGTGLGLTIARGIAEQHSGTLVLKNGVSKGLECHLDLPLNS